MYGQSEARALPNSAQDRPTARESHVGSQMGRQGQLVEEMANAISVLESRLQSVLRSTPPQPGTGAQMGKEPIQLVGHAAAISNQNDQLQNLIHSVSDIIDRLEL